MSVFTLRWQGPMASHVGARIDGFGQHQPIPSITAIAGLLGAALGLPIGSEELAELTASLRYAVIVHKPGRPLVDYQTADITAMPSKTWWNTGKAIGCMSRDGMAETRVQQRPFLADVDMTILVELADDARWTAQALLAALDEPQYPLCLGRENYPPTCRVAGEVLQEASLERAAERLRGLVYLPLDSKSGAEGAWGDVIVSVVARNKPATLFRVRNLT